MTNRYVCRRNICICNVKKSHLRMIKHMILLCMGNSSLCIQDVLRPLDLSFYTGDVPLLKSQKTSLVSQFFSGKCFLFQNYSKLQSITVTVLSGVKVQVFGQLKEKLYILRHSMHVCRHTLCVYSVYVLSRVYIQYIPRGIPGPPLHYLGSMMYRCLVTSQCTFH